MKYSSTTKDEFLVTLPICTEFLQVRQYFVQGWYPTGRPNPSNIYNPSGALVKAMLIHSAIGTTAYDGIAQGHVPLGELCCISQSHHSERKTVMCLPIFHH